MKEPKTIRGYISLIKKIERFSPASMDGFDDLDNEMQDLLTELDAAISNRINEIEDMPKKTKKKK